MDKKMCYCGEKEVAIGIDSCSAYCERMHQRELDWLQRFENDKEKSRKDQIISKATREDIIAFFKEVKEDEHFYSKLDMDNLDSYTTYELKDECSGFIRGNVNERLSILKKLMNL